MSSHNEDELLETLKWTDISFTLAEFVDKYPLPQVVRVERGYDGGTEGTSLGYGEVLTLHALRETDILTAEGSNGQALAIATNSPVELQLLPPLTDCQCSRCSAADLLALYPKIRYIEVLKAHYGTKDTDSTSVGEILEILSIEKRHKNVKVKNAETSQTFTITPACTSDFKPLLDWRRYSVENFKALFSFPRRVHFVAGKEHINVDTVSSELLSKTPDVTLVGETKDVLVVSTTVGSCVDLKYCYEIPKDLEVKVVVAEGFLMGDKDYQEVVDILDKGFDLPTLMSTHKTEFFKRRDFITQYNYEDLKDLFLNISKGVRNAKEGEEEEAPILPPRRRTLTSTKSVPLDPPPVPERPTTSPKARSTDDAIGDQPEIAPHRNITTRSLSFPDDPNIFRKSPQVPLRIPDDKSKVIPEEPSTPSLPPPPKPRPKIGKNKPGVHPSKVPLIAPKPQITVEKNSGNVQPVGNESQETGRKKTSQHTAPKVLPKSPKHSRKVSESAWKVFPVSTLDDPQPPPDYPETSQSDPSPTSPTPPVHPSAKVNDTRICNSSELPSDSTSTPTDPKETNHPLMDDFSKLPPDSNKIPTDPTDAKQNSLNKDLLDDLVNKTSKNNSTRMSKSSVFLDETSLVKSSPHKEPVSTKNEGLHTDANDNLYEELKPVKQPKTEHNHKEPSNTGENMSHVENTDGSSGTGWEIEDPYTLLNGIPKDLSGLSVSTVVLILRGLNMACYVETFRNELVDGDLLQSLQQEDMQSLGLSNFHIKKLAKFIKGWRPTL